MSKKKSANRFLLSCLQVLVMASASVSCNAEDYPDVLALMESRQYGVALRKIDEYLLVRANDSNLLFYKGVVESDLGKSNEAIATFSRLTQEFPSLPQPYSNLAILLIAQKQYAKARGVLESALQLDENDPVALQSLGDVYARLASSFYEKSMIKGGADMAPLTMAKRKILKEVFAVNDIVPSGGAARTMPVKRAVESAPLPPVEFPRQQAKEAGAQASTRTTPAFRGTDSMQEEVRKSVLDWAGDWARLDVDKYLSHYSDDFSPSGNQSRSAWVDARRARIGGQSAIDVKLKDLSIVVAGDDATVDFLQQYQAGKTRIDSRKRLRMKRQNAQWVIVKEISSN